ncbi:hypothetical protein HY988_03775 [Candidatus Micrarchaeota archaeon]|nr:hypothetical protein [Candidatus Micrarchaeota archaeon]
MKNSIMVLGVFGIILLAGCTGQNKPVDTSNAITKTMCEQYKGNWDDASSNCQCGGVAGFACPPSYVCGDYKPSKDTPDAMGICKKVSE